MKKPAKRPVRHRIRCTDFGLVTGPNGVAFYRERFETKCKGEELVFDSDVPKLTVVTQEHRDVEANATLSILRRKIVYMLADESIEFPRVVLNGNRKGLYWVRQR